MIDVKTAVRNAMKYLQEFHEFIPARAVRLEETDYDDSGHFLITLSTLDVEDPEAAGGVVGRLIPQLAFKRTYKVFRIDGDTGEVKSMKVRQLQPVD